MNWGSRSSSFPPCAMGTANHSAYLPFRDCLFRPFCYLQPTHVNASTHRFMLERTCQDCESRPQDLLTPRRQFITRLGLGFDEQSVTRLVGSGALEPAPKPPPETLYARL